MSVDQERQEAHAYLDRLPPAQLSAVRTLLRTIVEPVSSALANAPDEDENIGEDEERTAAEARAWLKCNDTIPHEDILAELGLSMSDFEHMGQMPVTPKEGGSR